MDEAQTSGAAAAQPVTSAPAGVDAGNLGQTFAAALQSHRQHRMAEAEGLYRQVLAFDPNHADALHMLGVLAYQAGRPEAAVDLIGRAIALHGDNPSFHNNIGEALRYLGRLDEAIAHFTTASELDPSAPEGQMNLGNALKQQGHLDQAIARYRRALELKPDYAEAYLNLGVALMEEGKLGEAADQYRRALAVNPNFPEALMNLAIVLQRRGEFAQAVAHYRRALELRPHYTAAHFNLGNALLERGNLTEALARYQHALALAAGAPPPTRALAPIESVRQAVNRTRALYPGEEPCFMNLVRANCWRTPAQDWRMLCAAALEQADLSQPSRFELLVRNGISQWLGDDRAALTDTLRAATEASTAIGPTRSREIRNSRAYANFLANLARHADAAGSTASDAGAPELAVIGDSHCLSFNGVAVDLGGTSYRTGAHLVMGCKAWHLANPQPNLYKWRLSAILDSVPENSPVICCFGEIDCRLDEGILPYYHRTGGDLEQLIEDETSRYVAYVAVAATPRRLKPILLGVPAPHLDALAAEHPAADPEDKSLLIDIVKVFNMYLRRAADERGFRVIDVFAVSAGPDGKASGDQHVDPYHLKPEALALALRQ
jgi:tetratricopeptide (TPR) repeat protein